MNEQLFGERLAGKIDTYERWIEIVAEVGLSRYERDLPDIVDKAMPNPPFTFNYSAGRGINALMTVPVEKRWWLYRELARQHYVHPSPSMILDTVTRQFHLMLHFPHISKDDPSLVAYTVSHEDGLRDKQVRLSFGKFLRKFMLLATDEHIQMMEASHRSEMDPTFKVATTEEDIHRIYTQMAGDSGCMRYPASQWQLPGHLHPSIVYASPGISVAYHTDGDRILSRAVIYDNPDDPKDKRWVRVYGDLALKRKLELNGYKMGTLKGAKLRAIDLSKTKPTDRVRPQWKPDTYLVPYLDGPGGRQEDRNGCFVYKIAGEDWLRVIDEDQAARVINMGYRAPQIKSTDPFHGVDSVPLEKLTFTSAHSGKLFNVLETDSVHVYQPDTRTVVQMAESERSTSISWTSGYWYQTADAPVGVVVHIPYDVAYDPAHVFNDNMFRGGLVIRTPEGLKRCGYVPLVPSHYGEDKWASSGDAVSAEDGFFWKKEDTVLVFGADGEEQWMPTVRVEEMRAANPKDYVQVAPNGKIKAVSHVSNPRLVTTVGKRRCISGWHSIVMTFDAQWDYEQNIKWITVFSAEIAITEKQWQALKRDTNAVRMAEATMQSMVFAPLASASEGQRDRPAYLRSLVQSRLHRGFNGISYFQKGEMLFRGHLYDTHGTLDQMRAAVTKIDTLSDQEITDMLGATYLSSARAWSYHAGMLLKLMDAKTAEWIGVATPPAAVVAEADNLLDTQLTVTARQIREDRVSTTAW